MSNHQNDSLSADRFEFFVRHVFRICFWIDLKNRMHWEGILIKSNLMDRTFDVYVDLICYSFKKKYMLDRKQSKSRKTNSNNKYTWKLKEKNVLFLLHSLKLECTIELRCTGTDGFGENKAIFVVGVHNFQW